MCAVGAHHGHSLSLWNLLRQKYHRPVQVGVELRPGHEVEPSDSATAAGSRRAYRSIACHGRLAVCSRGGARPCQAGGAPRPWRPHPVRRRPRASSQGNRGNRVATRCTGAPGSSNRFSVIIAASSAPNPPPARTASWITTACLVRATDSSPALVQPGRAGAVNHLSVHRLPRQRLGGDQRSVHLAAMADQGDVIARADRRPRIERHDVVADRNRLRGREVQQALLDDHHRVGVEDRRGEQSPVGVGRGCWAPRPSGRECG